MKRYVVLDKKIGETPLQALTYWKQAHARYSALPATYAGRLDPMASGKLLVLLGEECKRKSKYTNLDKEYEVSILLDLATDTGDVLGMPNYSAIESAVSREEILEACEREVGSRSHKYPAYSSKTVGGTPLFMHTLRGTLSTEEIPSHFESILSLTVEGVREVSRESLRGYIAQALKTVPRDSAPSKEAGRDFRQDEIREAWEILFSALPERSFTVIKIRTVCGTGTYMRTLAERIGHTLSTTALALSIHRTKIGTYREIGPAKLFFPSF